MGKFALIFGVVISLYLIFTRGVGNFLLFRSIYEKPENNFSRKDRLGQILVAILILGLAVLAWNEVK